MNRRTKTLWLPGLIGLTTSMVWLLILQRATLKPGLPGPWLHAGLAWMPYFIWMITQPLIGASVAYMSRHAEADHRTELIAILFPSIVMLGVWLVLITYVVIFRYSHISHQWPLALAGVLNWSIVPGLFLLLGRFVYLKTRLRFS